MKKFGNHKCPKCGHPLNTEEGFIFCDEPSCVWWSKSLDIGWQVCSKRHPMECQRLRVDQDKRKVFGPFWAKEYGIEAANRKAADLVEKASCNNWQGIYPRIAWVEKVWRVI